MMTQLNKKYKSFLFAGIMGISMGFMMSFVMTAVNIGFVPHFVESWLSAFAIGAAIGIPAALFLSPPINNLVKKLTGE